MFGVLNRNTCYDLGEVVVPGVAKQKKNMAAEGRNRKALGDIGNLATGRGVEGKPLPQVSRPVTRSCCAQVLAAAENQKVMTKKS